MQYNLKISAREIHFCQLCFSSGDQTPTKNTFQIKYSEEMAGTNNDFGNPMNIWLCDMQHLEKRMIRANKRTVSFYSRDAVKIPLYSPLLHQICKASASLHFPSLYRFTITLLPRKDTGLH